MLYNEMRYYWRTKNVQIPMELVKGGIFKNVR